MTATAAAARGVRVARTRLSIAMRAAREAAIIELASGATEVEVAKALGVNRTTIRRWVGKG